MSVPVVEIENLVKRYQELVALDHFNLTIEEGEIFGLLGPNGSGKTTTINCILALLAFDKGTVRVFGQEMRPDSYDLKRQIGVVMQNVAVFQELTVYENIDTIRTKLNPTDCQKFPVKLSSKSFRTTETGDARRISCFRYILANCQIAIQKSTANMRIPVYFVPLSVFALSFVIECIIRQLSSYNLRILIIQSCQIS